MLSPLLLLFAALLPAVLAQDPATSLSSLQSLSCSGAQCDIVASTSDSRTVPLRLIFWSHASVQWWLAVDGNFSNVGAAADVIVGKLQAVAVQSPVDRGAFWEISTLPESAEPLLTVRLTKSPLLLSVLLEGAELLRETASLAWNSSSSWQTLARDSAAALPAGLTKEWFFGGGMQNGRFSHRDQRIDIGVDYNWADGGHPNSVPFYMSSAGYGVLRNTWAKGAYTFGSPVVTSHDEAMRFDAIFFFAPASVTSPLKTVLGAYTSLTGRPFLPPLYALFLGDSDCYHNDRHGNSTLVAVEVAAAYREYDMPAGWMLPNDGYGCGYGEGSTPFPHDLDVLVEVVAKLHSYGFYSGLWTSTGMPYIRDEVGVAGTRVCKTDVGWIGDGYKYAFDGVALCASGIEDNADARRFIWTVEGWAGTHRNAVMWTGDDDGSYEYIRWQIPTYVGTGLSAIAHANGDVDGIFGGSAETYVRDLQFKALTTTVMTMSGWAANPDKQPWTYGEPYTTINRASLKLKARLTPYMYTYSRVAHDTGVPPIRAMLLEFPDQEALYAPSLSSNYQFMSGEWLLVAPVYDDRTVRDGIFLPAGTQWVDWWDGTLRNGGTTLDGYDCPLDKLPLFVRAGAIVPLWPPMNYFDEKPHDPISLELWPQGSSLFTLYEDDGVTREALAPEKPAFATTRIDVRAPGDYLGSGGGDVTVEVGPVQGAFFGQLSTRGWRLNVRCRHPPSAVLLDGAPLQRAASVAELEAIASGWFHDKTLQPQAGGLLMVKTPAMPAAAGWTVVISA